MRPPCRLHDLLVPLRRVARAQVASLSGAT
jgi:hypothetical protein